MGHVIPFNGDPHETTQRLLPWYATDRLEPAERVLVEEHLATCPDCAADLSGEQRLHAEVAALPPSPAGHWETLRDRALASPPPRRTAGWWSSLPAGRRITLAAAGQAGIMLLGIAAYDQFRQSGEPAYHALSAPQPQAARAGNVIVVFRPDSAEQAFRATLEAVGARLVDGPTAAGAYVLAVPPENRDAALADLRGRANVVLAQPIDGERPR